MGTAIISLFILLFIGEIEFNDRPRLDWTRDSHLLLWYGKTERKYYTLW